MKILDTLSIAGNTVEGRTAQGWSFAAEPRQFNEVIRGFRSLDAFTPPTGEGDGEPVWVVVVGGGPNGGTSWSLTLERAIEQMDDSGKPELHYPV